MRLRIVVVVVALGLFGLACSSGDEASNVDGAVSVSAAVAATAAAQTVDAAVSDVQTDDSQTETEPNDTVPNDTAPNDTVPPENAAATDDGLYPTVVDAVATPKGDGVWSVRVTMLSEYDSPERYADAWRVLDADGSELGIRVLTHDHAGEQPFARSANVDIPQGITTVFVEGRDQRNGWSGERFKIALPSDA